MRGCGTLEMFRKKNKRRGGLGGADLMKNPIFIPFMDPCNESIGGGLKLKNFFDVHPEHLGKMNPLLTHIFSNGLKETTN